MKLTIGVAVMGQLEDTKIFWGNLISNTMSKETVELLVINNNSQDDTKEFLERFVFPHFPDHRIIDNPDNVGVLASMQQIVDNAKGEVIAIIHNDLFILEPFWNERVVREFESDSKLGLAGFLGARRVGGTGGREGTMSNMLEAEVHGERMQGVSNAIIFDGLALIGRAAMFKQVGGFDQKYMYHHFYDRDISMASFTDGWTNKVIGVYCHHKSGVTANRPDYQTWIDGKMSTQGFTGDKASYDASEKYFINKWKAFLPNGI
jgi:GT2 family glycosyltransferase